MINNSDNILFAQVILFLLKVNETEALLEIRKDVEPLFDLYGNNPAKLQAEKDNILKKIADIFDKHNVDPKFRDDVVAVYAKTFTISDILKTLQSEIASIQQATDVGRKSKLN